MNNLIGAIALLGLTVPGFFLNSAFLKKERAGESLALSWLTGSVVFTLILYAINTYLGVPLNHQSSAIAFVILSLASFIIARKNIGFPKIDFKYNKLSLIIPIIIAVLMFITSFFYPVADWDAITLYDFRARILVNEGFLTGKITEMMYGGYPMYTSLLHFWAYITGLSSPMPIYPLFTISLFAGVYFASKRIFNKNTSLLVAVACVFAPRIFENSFIAYTNLPYTVFIVLGALYIYLFVRNRNWKSLIAGVFLTTATFWVRSFPFALINFALIFLAIPYIKRYSKYLAVGSMLLLITSYFLPLTREVADYLKWAVFEHYSPYWMIFVGIFTYKLIRNSKDWFWALAYLGYGLGLLVGTYIFENRFPGFSMSYNDAARRMTIFFNPIVILMAITILSSKEKQNEKTI